MRYFNHISEKAINEIFYKPPKDFYRNGELSFLSYALGATLYMPSTRIEIADDLIYSKIKGIISVVLCLEDAVGDAEVKQGERNIIYQLEKIEMAIIQGKINIGELPMIFLRIRTFEQMKYIINILGDNLNILMGFVIPKFKPKDIIYLEELNQTNKNLKTPLYAMPVLESGEIIHIENRNKVLLELKKIFDLYRNLILNIRIGGTDFSSLFSLRRSYDNTIYDVAVINHCIGDIVNVFGRNNEDYIMSGPVWEYFCNSWNTKDVLQKEIDGLIRECLLDKENGLVGKTIIHPSQLIPVQAVQVVKYEEYIDANTVLGDSNECKGAIKSIFNNKMNEIKPHFHWAKKIIKKAEIYGVYHEGKNHFDLLKR